jgi:hypothetical protein
MRLGRSSGSSRFNFATVLNDLSDISSIHPLSSNPENIIQLPWIQMAIASWGGDADVLDLTECLQGSRTSDQPVIDSGGPVKKRWEMLMNRIFPISSSSPNTGNIILLAVTLHFGLTSIGSLGAELPSPTWSSDTKMKMEIDEKDRDELLRNRFTELLADHLWAQWQASAFNPTSIGFHSLSSSPQPSSGPISSLTRAIRHGSTATQLAAERDSMSILWKVQATNVAKEYAQNQLAQAATLWNSLIDALNVPKSTQFEHCQCYHCYPKFSKQRSRDDRKHSSIYGVGSSNSFGSGFGSGGASPLMIPSSPILPRSIYPMIHLHRQSSRNRFDYVSNIIRATTMQQHSISPPKMSLAVRPSTYGRHDRGPAVDMELVRMFRVVKNVYVTMESLCFPFPVGFHTKFVLLGFHTLQQR